MSGLIHRCLYVMKAYFYLPITFLKRVVFGSDPSWKEFFWARWGVLSKGMMDAIAGRPAIWIVAQSGGEVIQISSFCKLLHAEFPGCSIVLSVNDRNALGAARKIEGVSAAFDQPWDVGSACTRLLKKVNPKALIFVQAVAFPMFLRKAHRQGVRTILINGFMDSNWATSRAQRRATSFIFYRDLDYIGVRNPSDADGYRTIGADPRRISITGDMRLDFSRFMLSDTVKEELRKELRITDDDVVFLGGSIYEAELRIVIDAYCEAKRAYPRLKLILAPRYSDAIQAAEHIMKAAKLDYVKRSAINSANEARHDAMILDTFGELARLYSVATVVFLGGSLIKVNGQSHGQNIIEPIAQKKPVLFGPYIDRWSEITSQFKRIYPDSEVSNTADLTRGILGLLGNDHIVDMLIKKEGDIVDQKNDSVQNSVKFVAGILNSNI